MKTANITYLVSVLLTQFFLWCTCTHAAGTARIITPAQAVKTVIQHNPSLAALVARHKAALNIPSQAGSLPDPVLSFGALNLPVDTFDLEQEPMTQMQVKLTQKIPFPGKLSAKALAEKHEADALGYQVSEMRLRLSAAAQGLWWDIYYLEKALAIVQKNRRLIQKLLESARARYEVGKGMQQDVLLAQVELADLLNDEARLDGKIHDRKARLAELAGNQELTSFDVDLGHEIVLVRPEDEEHLVEEALSNRPLILASRLKTDAAKARLDLSQKEYFPDFTVGAAYGFRKDSPQGMDRPDFASFLISVNLPLWANSKQKRQVAQKHLELGARQEAERGIRQQVRREIATALASYRSSLKQARYYHDAVIPQARLTLSSMMNAYQVNRVDFLNVIRARLALLKYEKNYWRAASGVMKADAALRAATGRGIKATMQTGQGEK